MKLMFNGQPVFCSGSASSADIYSTEEMVVGRWIDGKPLYRQIFVLPAFSLAKEGLFAVGTVLGIDTIFKIDGTIVRSNSDKTVALNMASSALQVTKNGNSSKIEYYTTAAYSYSGGICVIEYTKTTDQPTIAIPTLLTTCKSEDANLPDLHEAVYEELANGDDTPMNEEV